METREPSYTVGRKVNWCSHYGKKYEVSLKTKNRAAIYNLPIPLLGIYPEKLKTLIQKSVCTPMFTAALFTIAKTWKPPKCPSTENWFKMMWYIYICIYNGILISHKNE